MEESGHWSALWFLLYQIFTEAAGDQQGSLSEVVARMRMLRHNAATSPLAITSPIASVNPIKNWNFKELGLFVNFKYAGADEQRSCEDGQEHGEDEGRNHKDSKECHRPLARFLLHINESLSQDSSAKRSFPSTLYTALHCCLL